MAVLAVICSHAFQSNYEAGGLLLRVVGQVLHFGLFGVDLFFVLSGFLITGILFDSLGDESFFRKFYARRALRIFPLYYGVVLVFFALTPILHFQWGFHGWLIALYLQNFDPSSAMSFSPGRGIGVYHFWSLDIEEQFYLVWPAVVFFLRSRRAVLIATVVGSAGALILRFILLGMGTSVLAIHVATICRLDSLLIGGTLAMLYRMRAWTYVQRWAPLVFSIAAILIVASIMAEDALEAHARLNTYWTDGIRYTVLAIGFACLVAWSLQAGSVCERIFNARWLRFLGKYSYGIYVLHVFAIGALRSRIRPALFHLTHSKVLAVVLGGFIALGVGILAAYLSYQLFEKKFLRLKHHFDYTPNPTG